MLALCQFAGLSNSVVNRVILGKPGRLVCLRD